MEETLEESSNDVSEESVPQSSEDRRALVKQLKQQIESARKALEDASFYCHGEDAYKEYQGEKTSYQPAQSDEIRRLNIFHSIIETALPAYYSRTPKSEVSLRTKNGSLVESLGAQLTEAATQYCIEECQDFDSIAERAIKSFAIVGQGILWERYEAVIGEQVDELPVQQGEDGAFYVMGSDGPMTIPEQAEIQETEAGFVAVLRYETVVEEKSVTDFVHYKDYLEGLARFEEEIPWKARRVYLSRKEFEKQFPQFEDISKIKFDAMPREIRDQADSLEKRQAGKAELWELWHRERKKRYYVCESYDEDVISEGPVPFEVKGFFPCAPALKANMTEDSHIPLCDHYIIKDQLLEVERLTTRIHAIIESVRTNFLYDEKLGDKLSDFFDTDHTAIPAKGFELKNLGDGVMFFPVERYGTAIEMLYQKREDALNKIYQITGVSDLMRGATDPQETAAAQQIKSRFANLRFSKRQREVQRFVRDQLRIKAELVLAKFDDQRIAQIGRWQEMQQQIPAQMDEQGQPIGPSITIEQVLQFLREGMYREYSIDIETDSMVALDEEAEREQRNNFLNSVGGFVSQVLPALAQYPAMGDFFSASVMYAAQGYRAGKELHSQLEQGLSKFQAQLAQQAQEPQQQDPKMMESQVKLQIAQLDAQSDQQRMQVEFERAKLEQQTAMLELQIKQQETAVKMKQLELEASKNFTDLEKDSQIVKLQNDVAKMTMKLDRMAIESVVRESELSREVERGQVEKVVRGIVNPQNQ